MATFKCNDCGNLHGAPVETCGMCGSPAVSLVVDTMPPSGGAPADVTPDAFAATFGPMFEKAFDYVRERDESRTARLEELDQAEDERRNNVARAVTSLCAAMTDLAVAGAAFLRQQTPTVRDGGSK